MLVGRRAVAAFATAALVSRPAPAPAWCGAPYPPYAYSLPWFEFAAGEVSMRVVGDSRLESEKKLNPLLVLPSPGLTNEYLETLEAVTISQRRVAFATIPAAVPLTAASLAAAAAKAASSLEAPRVHVLGHGLGAAAALALASAQPATVASLILASPYSSLDDIEPSQREAVASGPSPLLASSATSARACVDAELKALRTRSPAALAAVRDGQLPPLSQGAPAAGEPDLLRGVGGLPVLLTRGGAGDVSSEATSRSVLARLGATASLATFDTSAALAHVDDRARYLARVLDFLDEADGQKTRRAVMLPGSMSPGGSIKSGEQP